MGRGTGQATVAVTRTSLGRQPIAKMPPSGVTNLPKAAHLNSVSSVNEPFAAIPAGQRPPEPPGVLVGVATP
jgi:hypothetical protein